MSGRGNCTVCRHTQAEKIDEQIIGGVAIRALSRRYGLAKTSLQRHQANHVNKVVVAAIDRATVAAGEAPGERLRRLYESALDDLDRLQRRAEGNKNYSVAVSAISQKLKALELFVAAASKEKKRDPARPEKIRISFDTKDNVIVRMEEADDEGDSPAVPKPEKDSSDIRRPDAAAAVPAHPLETDPPSQRTQPRPNTMSPPAPPAPGHRCTSQCTPLTCVVKNEARDADDDPSNPNSFKIF